MPKRIYQHKKLSDETNMNNKGFINIITIGIIGVAIIVSLGFYTKYEVNQAVNNNLGAVISTTSLTDTIGKLRTDFNTSITNVNTQLEGVSSTIGTYGTIVGENTPLAVGKGGTGTATAPTNGQIFASNGTTPVWKTLIGSGITISSTTTSTILTTQGIDTTADYSWSGAHSFSAGVTSTATTTLSNTIIGGTTSTISSNSLTITGTTTFTGNVRFADANRIKVFTASTTWVVPTGVTTIYVTILGGGGGGGGGCRFWSSPDEILSSGGGGSSGGYASELATTTVPGQTLTITIGNGGAGGIGGNPGTSGSLGATSTVGGLSISGGGGGGTSAIYCGTAGSGGVTPATGFGIVGLVGAQGMNDDKVGGSSQAHIGGFAAPGVSAAMGTTAYAYTHGIGGAGGGVDYVSGGNATAYGGGNGSNGFAIIKW